MNTWTNLLDFNFKLFRKIIGAHSHFFVRKNGKLRAWMRSSSPSLCKRERERVRVSQKIQSNTINKQQHIIIYSSAHIFPLWIKKKHGKESRPNTISLTVSSSFIYIDNEDKMKNKKKRNRFNTKIRCACERWIEDEKELWDWERAKWMSEKNKHLNGATAIWKWWKIKKKKTT